MTMTKTPKEGIVKTEVIPELVLQAVSYCCRVRNVLVERVVKRIGEDFLDFKLQCIVMPSNHLQ